MRRRLYFHGRDFLPFSQLARRMNRDLNHLDRLQGSLGLGAVRLFSPAAAPARFGAEGKEDCPLFAAVQGFIKFRLGHIHAGLVQVGDKVPERRMACDIFLNGLSGDVEGFGDGGKVAVSLAQALSDGGDGKADSSRIPQF